MNGSVRLIKPEDIAELLPGLTQAEIEVLTYYGQQSKHILAGMYNNEVLCVIGLIQPTFMSDCVYIWCHATPSTGRHKLVFGRHAKKLINHIRQTYPKIIGTCYGGSAWLWLQTLGARMTSEVEFEIG